MQSTVFVISQKDIGDVLWLHNTHEFVCATHLATCEGIICDKLTEEILCVDSTVRWFHIIKGLRDCLVS